MKTSKIMLAAVMAGSVTVLAGCGGPEVVNDPSGQGISQENTTTAYKNTSEGYTLNYPKVWQSQVSPEDSLDWNGKSLPADNVVVFNYTPAKGGSPEPLIALAVYQQSDLDKLENAQQDNPEFKKPTVIASQGDKVLVAYSRGSNPYSLTSADGQAFSVRALTPEQLKSAVVW